MLKVYTDGASLGNPGPGWAMWVILFSGGKRQKRVRLSYCTNNEAEYKAVIYALEDLLASEQLWKGEDKIVFHLDSKLVVQQVNGLFKVKNSNIRKYILRINTLLLQFSIPVVFKYIPREQNLADKLKYF